MPVPLSSGPVTGTRPLLKDLVYDRLLAAIEDGTLRPGERLNDAELGAWLGVSRTPIRQALSRLSALGLVVIRPNAFTRVAGPDPTRIAFAVDAAVTLWQAGVRLAMPQADDDVIAEVLQLYDTALAACQDAEEGRTTARAANETMHEATGAFVVRANRPVLLATLRKVEIELFFQIDQLDAAIDWTHTMASLRAARDAIARRDVPGQIAVLETFAHDVGGAIAGGSVPVPES